jgi:hypothetical protein
MGESSFLGPLDAKFIQKKDCNRHQRQTRAKKETKKTDLVNGARGGTQQGDISNLV